MAEIPFLHPALLGVAAAAGVGWMLFAAPRWRTVWACAAAAAVAAAAAAATGLTPLTGHLHLTGYAALMLLGFAAAFLLARARAAAAGIDPDHARIQLGLAAVAGVLGARAWYVIEYRASFPSPASDTAAWLTAAADLDRGGAVWFGGMLLAVAVMAAHTWRRGIPLIRWADCAAPAALAGLAIGRLGCFVNGCCWGAPCALPWAVDHGGVAVHPTQLYESLACAVLAALTLRLAPGHGAAAGWALAGYAAWRFANETLRGDYAVRLGQGFSLDPLHLTSAQWLCLPLAAGGAVLIVRAWRAGRAA